MSTKRLYCEGCTYPLSVCICYAKRKLFCPVNIIILQHPSESKHAKNSARLLPLCMNKVRICIGESPDDFAQLAWEVHSTPEKFALFYPNNNSAGLETHLDRFKQDGADNLIFIDATWRKALKIWKRNPWLHRLSDWHFVTPPKSAYRIRKTSIKDGLSTLEAVAYSLEQTQNIDCRPLLGIFNAMQKRVFRQGTYSPMDD